MSNTINAYRIDINKRFDIHPCPKSHKKACNNKQRYQKTHLDLKTTLQITTRLIISPYYTRNKTKSDFTYKLFYLRLKNDFSVITGDYSQ